MSRSQSEDTYSRRMGALDRAEHALDAADYSVLAPNKQHQSNLTLTLRGWSE